MPTIRVAARKEVQKVLLASPDVTALTGDRIHRGTISGPARVQHHYIEMRNVGGIFKDDNYEYADQRIDVFCFAPTMDEAEDLDTIVYGILDNIVGDLPIVNCSPGGSYDTTEGPGGARDPNIPRTGLFRPYRVTYIDHYEE